MMKLDSNERLQQLLNGSERTREMMRDVFFLVLDAITQKFSFHKKRTSLAIIWTWQLRAESMSMSAVTNFLAWLLGAEACKNMGLNEKKKHRKLTQT